MHSSLSRVAGLLWHHLFWTPVCLLSRNPLCRATNRKSEVSNDSFPTTSLYHSGFLLLNLTSLKRVFGMCPQSRQSSVPKRPLGTTHGKLSATKIASSSGKLQFLVCPLFCPPVPSIELPSFFALVMPLNMPSTDILKCPLYILPFFNGMPSRGMLYFQMC